MATAFQTLFARRVSGTKLCAEKYRGYKTATLIPHAFF